jgi:hypothetical protein
MYIATTFVTPIHRMATSGGVMPASARYRSYCRPADRTPLKKHSTSRYGRVDPVRRKRASWHLMPRVTVETFPVPQPRPESTPPTSRTRIRRNSPAQCGTTVQIHWRRAGGCNSTLAPHRSRSHAERLPARLSRRPRQRPVTLSYVQGQ